MLKPSNKDVKRKELYKLTQQRIKMLGVVKDYQQVMIYCINEMAIAELENYNPLRKSVLSMNMKRAVKAYTKAFMELKTLEKDIMALQEWKPED